MMLDLGLWYSGMVLCGITALWGGYVFVSRVPSGPQVGWILYYRAYKRGHYWADERLLLPLHFVAQARCLSTAVCAAAPLLDGFLFFSGGDERSG